MIIMALEELKIKLENWIFRVEKQREEKTGQSKKTATTINENEKTQLCKKVKFPWYILRIKKKPVELNMGCKKRKIILKTTNKNEIKIH